VAIETLPACPVPDYPSSMRAWLARVRWRRRGAWLWPTFTAATVLDGVLVHALPTTGTGEDVFGGVVLGMVLNVLAVVLVSRPGGLLLRRPRPDLPVAVARDYAGTYGVLMVTAALLAAGLIHHPTLVGQQRTLDEVVARAEAYIGDRAPVPFRANAGRTDTFTIEAGIVYRTCVLNLRDTETFCVIVRPRMPFAQSVTFAGYEPNSTFAQGVN
jgi:hypothetical protein